MVSNVGESNPPPRPVRKLRDPVLSGNTADPKSTLPDGAVNKMAYDPSGLRVHLEDSAGTHQIVLNGLEEMAEFDETDMGLGLVEVVLELEESFSIEIADAETEAVKTAGHLTNLVARKLRVLERDELHRETVWNEVRRVIARHAEVDEELITEQSTFGRDIDLG